MTSDILAAVDIGSNAVRLLIYYLEVEGATHDLKKNAYLRIPIRLGEDVFTSGRVSDAKAERLLEAMRGFRYIMRAYGVSAMRACATSAMRDAANGAELATAVKETAGIDIEIINGQEEADLIYAASSQSVTAIDDEAILYVDVGGGSTELVLYKNGRLHFHDSFHVGTVRMLINAGWNAKKERFARGIKDIHAGYAPTRVIASGGNINKVHKLLGKKNGDPIRPDELKDLLAKLKPLNIAQRIRTFGLNDYRADVIVPALEIFLCISEHCPAIRNFYVPKLGLADGLIHDMYKKRLAAGIYNQEDQYGR
jgi:exopolyphosphatase/guanosine-5'-triphosphate,3'-diphosphate pyrophosphatase